jgi:hypothetical protein
MLASRPALALCLTLCLALAACTEEKTCATDQTVCGDACAVLTTDPSNCGACGHACGEGQVCTAGACLYGTAQNCGALGRTCGSGERCVSGACLADLYLACYNTDEVRGATSALAPAGVPLATAAGPIALAWLDGALYVADSRNNTVDAIRFDPPEVRKADTLTIPIGSVGYADLEGLAAANGLLYASNAAANVLDVLDPVARALVDEIPLGGGAFPAGVLVSGSKAYVALNGTNEVAVVDVSPSGACAAPPCGTVSKRIALPPAELASAGGSPMPARLAIAGGKLYVTLWNLDPSTFAPAGNGRLAVVDTATDTLVTTAGSYPIDLGAACQNPADVVASGQVLYVTCGFFPWNSPGTISGAAIVPVDVSTATPSVGPALPLSGNAPGAVAVCGGAAYAGDRASGAVLKYDPGTNAVTATEPLCPAPSPGAAAYVAAIACGG